MSSIHLLIGILAAAWAATDLLRAHMEGKQLVRGVRYLTR